MSAGPSGLDAQELVGCLPHEPTLYVSDRLALVREYQVLIRFLDADPLERVVLPGESHLPIRVQESDEDGHEIDAILV